MTAPHAPLRTVLNPELAVQGDGKATWNLPAKRRAGFHALHRIARYGLTIRAPSVLVLETAPDPGIARLASLERLTGRPDFSAMAVVRGQTILFERYAADFGPDRLHSIQSVSKLAAHLIVGGLVEAGLLDPEQRVRHYLPEVGSGYAGATLQQVLDMDLVNNFHEDYGDSYRLDPRPGAPMGYNRQEIAMGWRLPPEGEAEASCRAFAAALTSDDLSNPSGEIQYRSPNTDLLGWIAERVSGKPLRDHLIEIVEAAGLEAGYFISCDREGTPVISGGACVTARDLARLGLLFARWGRGVNGRAVGSEAFTRATLASRGTRVAAPRDWVRYSNHSYTNGRWIGHSGFAGQFLMADPRSGTAVAFFSVLETPDAEDETHFPAITRMGEEIIALIDAGA